MPSLCEGLIPCSSSRLITEFAAASTRPAELADR